MLLLHYRHQQNHRSGYHSGTISLPRRTHLGLVSDWWSAEPSHSYELLYPSVPRSYTDGLSFTDITRSLFILMLSPIYNRIRDTSRTSLLDFSEASLREASNLALKLITVSGAWICSSRSSSTNSDVNSRGNRSDRQLSLYFFRTHIML